MKSVTVQDLYDQHSKISQLWGNKNSTFEEISTQIGKMLILSLYCDTQDKAESIWNVTISEWLRRSEYFLLKSSSNDDKSVVKVSLSKFPMGKHYYVTCTGAYQLVEKFNTAKEAKSFKTKMVAKLKNNFSVLDV
jgi:hypothetical protein